MLDFEYGLRSVLHAERDVGERILVEIAIDGLHFLAGRKRNVPPLVPLSEFGEQHVAHGGSDPIVGNLVGAYF